MFVLTLFIKAHLFTTLDVFLQMYQLRLIMNYLHVQLTNKFNLTSSYLGANAVIVNCIYTAQNS